MEFHVLLTAYYVDYEPTIFTFHNRHGGYQVPTKNEWSPGLAVMWGNSCSKGCGFESRHPKLDEHFFPYICCKNCNDVCLNIPKINNKRGRGWPFLKKKNEWQLWQQRWTAFPPSILFFSFLLFKCSYNLQIQFELWNSSETSREFLTAKFRFLILKDEWIFKRIWFNFLNGPFPASFSLWSHFQNSQQYKHVLYKNCWWVDSNQRPLMLEATALLTVPQPLTHFLYFDFILFPFIFLLRLIVTSFPHPPT